MTLLLRILKINGVLKVPIRWKNGPNHWSMQKKKIAASDKALEHFDDFYQSVYGEAWPNIRSALLKKNNKHMAILNNFGDTEGTIEKFELLGAINLKSLYEAQRKQLVDRQTRVKSEKDDSRNTKMEERMQNILSEKQTEEVQSVYPGDYEPSQKSLEGGYDDEKRKFAEPMKPMQMRPIEEDLADAKLEQSRIVKPSMGITSSPLHEYIPATKIKGLDDWVLESDHYSYYNRGADFVPEIEKDPVINFPEHLKIYTFEALNDTKFPTPRRGKVDVYDYYMMDGGSILPVLALDLKPGDVVLDMCAAPGGKTFAALQTLMPRVLVANDVKLSRVNRINEVLDEYLGDLDVWNNRLFVTNNDAREIDETNMYNKILVDVPCTTDRHILHEDDNNIFKSSRVRERIQLPELQAEILARALKLIAPGGIVVYSTCSLSPIQNDGVVQMALKKNWEDTQSSMVVMDMMEGLEPLRCLYKFGDFGLKYGHIVIPTKANNWGPMYWCKITRAR